MLSTPNALLSRGLLAVVLGIVSVAWPGITIGAIVILFAIYAFTAAGLETVRAFASDRAGAILGWLLLALLSLVAGVTALAWPGITALVLTVWVGLWALTTGVTEIAIAFRRGEAADDRVRFMLGGLISLALALVLFARPDIGAVSLAVVFGLFSIIYGVSAVVTSFEERRLLKRLNRSNPVAA